MKKSQPTLKDIAEAAKVSISTVSRALKGHSRIGKKTSRRIVKLATEMGYVSSEFVYFENDGPSRLIGVIVPEVGYHLYAQAISGIEKIAETRDMHIIVCQSNESQERERSIVKELIGLKVAGVIASLASETTDFSHFEALQKNKIPLVFFNRKCNEITTDKVIIDNFKAAFDATAHMISIGCKKIAFLGGPKILQINSDRAEGYKAALKEHGLAFDNDLLVYTKFHKDSMLSAARKLLYLPNYPDGVLAFSDQVAINVMLAAKERGIKMPEEVSVVGFNNEPVGELLEPSLTSVDQPSRAMGEEAAKLILKQIDNANATYETKTLKSYLIVRNSTNKNKVL